MRKTKCFKGVLTPIRNIFKMRYTPQIDVETEASFSPILILTRLAGNIRWPVMAMVILYCYLAFHAFSGSQGIVNWMNNDSETARLSLKLERLQNNRAILEAKVQALGADQLDLDALDIVSRNLLHYSDPKELTIWLDLEG